MIYIFLLIYSIYSMAYILYTIILFIIILLLFLALQIYNSLNIFLKKYFRLDILMLNTHKMSPTQCVTQLSFSGFSNPR